MKKHSHARRIGARSSAYISRTFCIALATLVLAAAVMAAFPRGTFFLTEHAAPLSLFFPPTDPGPRTIPYHEDFSMLAHSSTVYPAGWQGWVLGGGSTTTFRTTPPVDSTSLVANSTSATVAAGVHNYNGKLGFLPTGSTDPSLVLALDTTDKAAITVAFDMMTIRNQKDGTNTRINQVDLQYRVCPAQPVECAGPFAGVSLSPTGIYQNNTTNQTSPGTTNPQNLESKTYVLPASANDQPNVQVRWVQRDAGGGGSRPSFAIDNINVTAAPSCVPPTVTGAPANQLVTYGVLDVSFTATAAGDPVPSVQWQVDTGVGFIDVVNGSGVSGADTPTLTIAVPEVSMSGNLYRAVFSNACQSVSTPAAILSVAPKLITVTPYPGQSKVYGDPEAVITYGSAPSLLFSDTFSGQLGRDPGESVGAYEIVQGSLILSPNYDLVFTSGITFAVTPKELAAGVVVNEKVYDGADAATASCSLTGVIVPDVVECSAGPAAFPGRNAGAYSVTVSGITLSGADSGNYNLASTSAADQSEILVRPVTISAVGGSKMYDGIVASSGVPVVSVGSIVAGDSAAFAQSYADRHAGSNKILAVSATIDDGNGGDNYVVNFITANGAITPRPVIVTAVAATKVLDGNTSSNGIPTVAPPLIDGDAANFIQTYDTPSGGTGKTLTPAGIAIDGNDGLNYFYTFVSVNSGVITTSYCFDGFASPIGGAVENGNGGTFNDPVRTFKLNSTIPIKFSLYEGVCGGTPVTTGVHTLQMIKYANVVDSAPAIDATPTDAATTGNEFRLVDTRWHYNLDTKRVPGISPGTWLIKATLSDGSVKTVWISIKK